MEHLPETVLVTDIGSTTTKALLFERTSDGYRLLGRAEAPTTVEKPTEDVTVGLLEAAKRLGERVGRRLVEDERLAVGSGFDKYLSTSSAGGGLQILVSGLSRSVTAKSAYRAACAAGGVLLDVLAIDDGRTPFEKVEAIEELRPDMLLIAGGIDGGDVANVVRSTAVIVAAELKPKYGPEGKLPVVFAGNPDARAQIESLLRDRAELVIVDNLRPAMDRENIDPAREAIHRLFTEHVMAHAPGYEKVMEWTALPIEPTPVAVERMLRTVSEKLKKNIIMVDIGGATTDVFSSFDGINNRTVSANLGMSYSASNVLFEAGIENIIRWLSYDVDERKLHNLVANKSIHPTRLPSKEVELEVEQAVAREALRLALKTHLELSVYIRRPTFAEKLKALLRQKTKPTFTEHEYIDLSRVDVLFGSGGVLSHAPRRTDAARMLLDGLQPYGVTELAVDSVFMMPHLGTLAKLSEDSAFRTFEKECIVHLGTAVTFSGRLPRRKPAGRLLIRTNGGEKEITVTAGELKIVRVDEEEFDLEVRPVRGVDAGGGGGKRVRKHCRRGEVGLLIDARGRPIRLPEEPSTRQKLLKEWKNAFEGE